MKLFWASFRWPANCLKFIGNRYCAHAVWWLLNKYSTLECFVQPFYFWPSPNCIYTKSIVLLKTELTFHWWVTFVRVVPTVTRFQSASKSVPIAQMFFQKGLNCEETIQSESSNNLSTLNKTPSIKRSDWLKMFNSQSECLKLA